MEHITKAPATTEAPAAIVSAYRAAQSCACVYLQRSGFSRLFEGSLWGTGRLKRVKHIGA
jgi:hypothetical protein